KRRIRQRRDIGRVERYANLDARLCRRLGGGLLLRLGLHGLGTRRWLGRRLAAGALLAGRLAALLLLGGFRFCDRLGLGFGRRQDRAVGLADAEDRDDDRLHQLHPRLQRARQGSALATLGLMLAAVLLAA